MPDVSGEQVVAAATNIPILPQLRYRSSLFPARNAAAFRGWWSDVTGTDGRSGITGFC